MYADLQTKRHDDAFRDNPLVRAVAGADDGLPPIHGLLSASELDEQVSPSEVYQVRDADASQQETIEAIKRGASLVVQGPPGTGKSQTITNIIAECLAQDKTVLFVSEKMTALRVVAKWLTEAGLSSFCLQAHSQDVNKASIVKELASTLHPSPKYINATTETVSLEGITRLRRQLNTYVRALHDTGSPLGWSAFKVHGEVACRANAPGTYSPAGR
jgi:hypothetical protein